MVNPQFVQLLEEAVGKLGTQSALAKLLGITESRLAKVLRGDAGGMNPLNCMKLAEFLRYSPSTVLRAAGHAELADYNEKLYGHVLEPQVGTEQALESWKPHGLPEDVTEAARTIFGWLDKSQVPKRRKKRKR